MCCSTHPKLFTKPVISLDGFITKKKGHQMLLLPKLLVRKICMYMAKKKREKRNKKFQMNNWYELFTVICFSKLSHAFHENIPDRWKVTWPQKNSRRLLRTEAKGTSNFTNCSLLLNEICIEISI